MTSSSKDNSYAKVFFHETLQIQLEYSGLTRLPDSWANCSLGGLCWRLYHHDKGGAGVINNGKKTELEPDKVYLLPPACNLKTWNELHPVQLYFHFYIADINAKEEALCNEIKATPEMLNDIHEIRESFAASAPGNYVHNQLMKIALIASALSRMPAEAFRVVESDLRITDTCRYIRKNVANPELSLDTLAERVHMATNAFARCFRNVIGVTPYQYILQLRYTNAARLLSSSKLDIDAVCEDVGIRDRFHFSRTFKHIFGWSPAAFRKNGKFSC